MCCRMVINIYIYHSDSEFFLVPELFLVPATIGAVTRIK